MNILTKTLIILSSALFITAAYAGTNAGSDSARYYKTYPEKWEDSMVSVDCTSVTRINAGPQIEGIVFFIAHTYDDKNDTPGGSIVVAVMESDVDSFIRKYGTVIVRDNGSSDRVENTRLRGTFHQLAQGHVYVDESGYAQDLPDLGSRGRSQSDDSQWRRNPLCPRRRTHPQWTNEALKFAQRQLHNKTSPHSATFFCIQ
jgi:hypothetical protein